MIPYLEPPQLVLGGFTFHAFGFLAGTALALGWWMIVRRSARLGGPAYTGRLAAWMLALGLLGACLGYWLLHGTLGLYSFGGILGGLVAAVVLASALGMSSAQTLHYLDTVAFVFPFSWTIARTGCFLAHEHVGKPSTRWYAVKFPDGPRLDLGLIEAAFSAALALVWLLLDRPRSAPGPRPVFLGLLLVFYGAFRLFLDTLQNPPSSSAADRGLSWTCLLLGSAALKFSRMEV